MKRIAFGILILAALAAAQVAPVVSPAFPARVVGANLGVCPSCTPEVAGSVWYAARIAQGDHPTYSYTLVSIDKVQVNSFKPLNVQVLTSTETGLAQHITRFRGFDVFATGTAGAAVTSTNAGFAVGGGFAAFTGLGKGWLAGGYFRINKASIVPDVGWKIGLTVALGSN